MRHFRNTLQRYAKLNESDKNLQACTFCHEYKTRSNIVYENKTMFIMPNRVSYDMFEGQRVTEHFMVIPKRHVETIQEFSEQEMHDQMMVLGEYEGKGYDIYARGTTNITRSVKHQHTHLIKGDGRRKWPRFLIFIGKPYFLISK